MQQDPSKYDAVCNVQEITFSEKQLTPQDILFWKNISIPYVVSLWEFLSNKDRITVLYR